MNSVPTNLWEWLTPIQPADRLPIVVVAILFGLTALVFIVGLITHMISKIQQARLESALKHELLERGLSADEIATVVASTTGSRRGLKPSQQ